MNYLIIVAKPNLFPPSLFFPIKYGTNENKILQTTKYNNLLLHSMYNGLVERCFQTCVASFRSKSLDKYETTCVENCAERYIKMTQRVGLRFAEHQAMQQKRAADAAGN